MQGEKVKELFGDDVETVYVSLLFTCFRGRAAVRWFVCTGQGRATNSGGGSPGNGIRAAGEVAVHVKGEKLIMAALPSLHFGPFQEGCRLSVQLSSGEGLGVPRRCKVIGVLRNAL